MIFYDFLLTVLWYLSVLNQLSSDYSDSDHLSPHPWYLRKSCRVVETPARTACVVSQLSFVISIFLL